MYENVFNQIASEDIEYMDDDEFEAIPKFGNSRSSTEEVVTFYGYWESYSTKKSFAWLFTHDVTEIRDRRVLKLVDKEHKKIQQKARKERNEEIRSLVQFVKKRDKRMIEYRKMLEEKAAQNRLKSQQNRLEQIKKRSEQIKDQMKNSQKIAEHEEQLKQLEKDYFNQYSDSESDYNSDEVDEDIEGDMENCQIDSDGNEEMVEDELYCVACNKFFNSERSKANHDGSKKHKQNLEVLKSEMKQEEENFQKNLKDENEISDSEIIVQEAVKPKSKKSKKKSKKIPDPSEMVSEEEVEETTIKLVNSDIDDDWSASASNKKGKKLKSDSNKSKKQSVVPEKNTNESLDPSSSALPLKETSSQEKPDQHRCATCTQIFPSKNKLFNHLKATNHSVYLGDVKQNNSEKSKGKKKK